MNELSKYDDIRCYEDAEIKDVFGQIANEDAFKGVVQYLFPDKDVKEMLEMFKQLDNKAAFQRGIIYPLLQRIERDATDGISSDGIENVRDHKSCMFLSNHRDIVLDSALLCKELIESGLDTVEIAIGDNLLIYPWITAVVRANKSFIVKRGGGVREMLANSQRMSSYIDYVLHTKEQSIWMAQREGRAKDSNDRTQESLLKMLNMGGQERSFLANMKALNICPVAISYEYDPCDYLKAKEFQQKRDDAEFKKSKSDDLLNMQIGIMGKKGRVMFRFMPSINEALSAITTENKNEQVAATAQLVDKYIHSGYELYSGNKVAYDLMTGTDTFAGEYTAAEKSKFEMYVQGQLDKIDLPNKDEAYLRMKMWEMYGNPAKNQLAVVSC